MATDTHDTASWRILVQMLLVCQIERAESLLATDTIMDIAGFDSLAFEVLLSQIEHMLMQELSIVEIMRWKTLQDVVNYLTEATKLKTNQA